jgi:uncharacterized protein YbjT (DUF2867 family)
MTMNKKTFAIVGATGQIGTVIVETLLKNRYTIHAIGRNEEKLLGFEKKGAKTFRGAFEDATMLSEAFRGTDVVLSLLPFSYDMDDVGVSQDTMGEAIQQALQHAGVERVVSLSSIGAHKNHGSASMKGIYRHEQRLNAIPHLKVLHFRPGWFMENFVMWIQMIKNLGCMRSTLRADVSIPMVSSYDIGQKIVEFFEKMPTPQHTVFEYVGPRSYTMTEATAILGAAVGMPSLQYVQCSDAEMEKGMLARGMTPSVVKNVLDLNKMHNEGHFEGVQKITSDHRGITTLEGFAKEFAKLGIWR